MNKAIKQVQFFIGALLLGLMFTMTAGAEDEIKIGILAKRGTKTCLEKWSAMGSFLEKELNTKVIIVPMKFDAIEPAVRDKKIDFVLANSAFYAVLEKRYGIKSIVSMINSNQGKSLNQFGGVILVRKDSPIKTLEDLKGHSFMCVNYSSFGGGHMAWRLMLENGIDPQKDCSKFIEGNKHDNVILAIKAGVVDAGTVRSDTLERMEIEGKIKVSDFRVIHPIDDDFPFLHSTRLYPEWPMAACAHVDPDLQSKMRSALKKITPESDAAKTSNTMGWTDSLDYSPVSECLTAIDYKPFTEM